MGSHITYQTLIVALVLINNILVHAVFERNIRGDDKFEKYDYFTLKTPDFNDNASYPVVKFVAPKIYLDSCKTRCENEMILIASKNEKLNSCEYFSFSSNPGFNQDICQLMSSIPNKDRSHVHINRREYIVREGQTFTYEVNIAKQNSFYQDRIDLTTDFYKLDYNFDSGYAYWKKVDISCNTESFDIDCALACDNVNIDSLTSSCLAFNYISGYYVQESKCYILIVYHDQSESFGWFDYANSNYIVRDHLYEKYRYIKASNNKSDYTSQYSTSIVEFMQTDYWKVSLQDLQRQDIKAVSFRSDDCAAECAQSCSQSSDCSIMISWFDNLKHCAHISLQGFKQDFNISRFFDDISAPKTIGLVILQKKNSFIIHNRTEQARTIDIKTITIFILLFAAIVCSLGFINRAKIRVLFCS